MSKVSRISPPKRKNFIKIEDSGLTLTQSGGSTLNDVVAGGDRRPWRGGWACSWAPRRLPLTSKPLLLAKIENNMVPKAGFEPARVSPPPPQDGVSTRFHHLGTEWVISLAASEDSAARGLPAAALRAWPAPRARFGSPGAWRPPASPRPPFGVPGRSVPMR